MFKIKNNLLFLNIFVFIFFGLLLIFNNHQVMAMNNSGHVIKYNNYNLNPSYDFVLETKSVFVHSYNWDIACEWKNTVLKMHNINQNIEKEIYQTLLRKSMKLCSLIRVKEKQCKLIYELQEIRKNIRNLINLRQNIPQNLLENEKIKLDEFQALDNEFFRIKDNQ